MKKNMLSCSLQGLHHTYIFFCSKCSKCIVIFARNPKSLTQISTFNLHFLKRRSQVRLLSYHYNVFFTEILGFNTQSVFLLPSFICKSTII